MLKKLLFLDDSELKLSGGVALRIMPPMSRKTVIKNDKPWESMFIGFYSSYIYDNGIHKLYYSLRDGDRRCSMAMAESTDGYNWTKPELGQREYHGSSANNLIDIGSLECTMFLDPKAKDGKRYKCLTHIDGKGLFVLDSADGISWSQPDSTVLPYFCDSQNVMFYDEQLDKYVCYMRGWDRMTEYPKKLMRVVKRAEISRLDAAFEYDKSVMPFRRTTDEQPIVGNEFPTVIAGNGNTDIYTSAAQPYPDAPGYFLAFPTFYRHFPSIENGGKYDNDGEINVCFTGSCDGIRWHQYDGEPYVKNEIGGEFACRMAFINPGMTVDGDILRFYGSMYRTTHGANPERLLAPDGKIVCYEQRRDGFVSVHFTNDCGEMNCKLPDGFIGKELFVNCDCGTCGHLQFSFDSHDESVMVTGNSTALSLGRCTGENMRVVGKNANLFSVYIK